VAAAGRRRGNRGRVPRGTGDIEHVSADVFFSVMTLFIALVAVLIPALT
jgi:hypothetical protein